MHVNIVLSYSIALSIMHNLCEVPKRKTFLGVIFDTSIFCERTLNSIISGMSKFINAGGKRVSCATTAVGSMVLCWNVLFMLCMAHRGSLDFLHQLYALVNINMASHSQ